MTRVVKTRLQVITWTNDDLCSSLVVLWTQYHELQMEIIVYKVISKPLLPICVQVLMPVNTKLPYIDNKVVNKK